MLDDLGRVAFDEIVAAVRAGKCTLFMGAAVHAPPPQDDPKYKFPKEKLPPIGEGLARELASDHAYRQRFPDDDTSNLARVAQTSESLHRRDGLVRKVRELVETGKEPSPVLRALAKLDFPIVVTTNYDTLFQKALGLALKVPTVSSYHSNEDVPLPTATTDMKDTPQPSQPFLYKMHGDIQTGESLVLTDEDYIQFILRLRDPEPLHVVPNVVLAAMKTAPTLFVGYSLRDYNLRVLLKRLRSVVMTPEHAPPTYSIDLSPDPIIWDVWYSRRRFVNFVALNVWEFVPKLYQAVTGQEMPE
ncbi:hypothetical protein SBA6_410078 [Candidatus Sulfopaludibacter sp. SbA6]|nr:hypothetical protein SBA6_410078 [Candidatus Sulfopaludibacter sp. SbA6]